MGRVQGILEYLFCCLLSGGKSRFVRHLQSKTQTAAALQNPIVDANSEPRLNTNLQEDYPKKLFVFMQFVCTIWLVISVLLQRYKMLVGMQEDKYISGW